MYEQLDLFGFAPSQYIIKKPIRLIELFAGIGAQSKALEVLKANFESYKIAEWSKESIKAYNKISPAICTSVNPYFLTKHLRIRKLTPCECYKLMGFTQGDYEKCAKIQSNATIYHQAGDSIVVTVLIAIFGKLLGIDYEKVIKEYVKGEILK